MKISIAKLKAILLYFSNYTNTTYLGKVKLMKLFYFLDFMHVKQYCTPITYDTYIKLEHGPIPSTIKNLVDTACDNIDESILFDTIKCETPINTNMFRILPIRDFNESDKAMFTPSELDILNKVCQRFGDKNTKYIEDASHKEAAYTESVLLQEIPYTLAIKDSDCQATEEEIKLFLEIA